VLSAQQEAGGELVADPKYRVDSPRFPHLSEREFLPRRELLSDEPSDSVLAHAELVGVHRHDCILLAATLIAAMASPSISPEHIRTD
ncbi:MAG: hypothetical protein ACRDTT_34420, partial [Pseudonocardiaceae bacterium]